MYIYLNIKVFGAFCQNVVVVPKPAVKAFDVRVIDSFARTIKSQFDFMTMCPCIKQ